jgi:hypothetical protein
MEDRDLSVVGRGRNKGWKGAGVWPYGRRGPGRGNGDGRRRSLGEIGAEGGISVKLNLYLM